ncbi:protein-tyrosine-phosphatase [Halalkalibaculum sp. DA384]|uniref:protein-tyrosine-phosphatase n=1 Tax=Halalkalibaculum sp. DA384 TaxID=3373606 RepID=UPI003754117C
MYLTLQSYIKSIENEKPKIDEKRRTKLTAIAEYIREKRDSGSPARLTFICTHNSRRSHLCQIWAAVMAEHLGVNEIETYSGGTEATAFNPRAVAAIERAGFKVQGMNGENPRYNVFFDEDKEPLVCFSKTFDDDYNPQEHFAAVMTCTDADENCPFIPGAEKRFSIPYVDPKESDGTAREKETYDERCRQIAVEMYNLISQV